MNRVVLKLVVESFSKWLYQQFPPSGKPAVFDFSAEAKILIEAITPESGPPITDPAKLDEAGIVKLLEWLFVKLSDAYSADKWPKLAIHALWKYSFQAIPWMLNDIANSRDSSHNLPAVGNNAGTQSVPNPSK